MIVIKIGGSVLRRGKDYVIAARRIKEDFIERGERVIVVVSAMKSVTDLLIRAANGDIESAERVMRIYREAANEAGLLPRGLEEVINALRKAVERGPSSLHDKEYIVSLGETMSSLLMAEALAAEGLSARRFDARKVIVAESTGAIPKVDYRLTARNALRVRDAAISGAIPVIEGFVASLPGGHTITLGRGGSDYTATVLAVLTGAREVYFVTDVPGIMSADPRLVKDARIVPSLDHSEASEASSYGAKRIHPRAFEALIDTDVIALIGNWALFGTAVTPDPEPCVRPKLVASSFVDGKGRAALVGRGVCRHSFIASLASELRDYDGSVLSVRPVCPRPAVVLDTVKEELPMLVRWLHTNFVLGGEP